MSTIKLFSVYLIKTLTQSEIPPKFPRQFTERKTPVGLHSVHKRRRQIGTQTVQNRILHPQPATSLLQMAHNGYDHCRAGPLHQEDEGARKQLPADRKKNT